MRLNAVTSRRTLVVVLAGALAAGACSSSKHGASPSSTSAPGATTLPSAPATTGTRPVPTSATTTTPPHPSGDTPRSATFVSPRHGWLLESTSSGGCGEPGECDYRVLTTTDGGTSWTPVGTPGVKLGGAKIRFADARHGFVYDSRSFLTTVDGGAHWTPTTVPFHTASALEISAGVVFAVGDSPVNGDAGFHVWSSPVASIQWKRDPLLQPFGAGPVPEQELVFQHGSGWLLNVDRTITSAARLSGSASWVSWTPPCATLNGPAHISASSATDVVASCDEHVWDAGPIAPAVYFSHDGGTTFRRHPAPGWGRIGAPNATTAVVVDGTNVWRTTDEGVSWHTIGLPIRADNATDLDFGFTTSTQGFLVEGTGGMFMTHDAGATWTALRLP